MATPSGNEARSAGWYPDPSGRHAQRYWDGTDWSAHVSDGSTTTTDPTPPLTPPPLVVVTPHRRGGRGKKILFQVFAVLVAIGIVAWYVNREAPDPVAPVTTPDVGAPVEPAPPQSILRRRYAGTYEHDVDGTTLWLHKNGKYSYEGYTQWGDDLRWTVVGRTIHVVTYMNVDWAGRSEVRQDVYDIRNDGEVLVLRKRNARAKAGTRYVKVASDST